MRICSFLPAATEILFALGLGDQVVGVSHECDFPPQARAIPVLTVPVVDAAAMTSAEIDAAIADAVAAGSATYRIDMDRLRAAAPDLVLTQDLCVVCAVGGGEVRAATVALSPSPRVLSLDPSSVADILENIREVARAAAAADRGGQLVGSLRERLEAVRAAVAGAPRPRVLCLEWIQPAWAAGHWMPEVVELAGGVDVLGRTGEPSRRIDWDEVVAAAPDVVLIMPCGFDVERSMAEIQLLAQVPQLPRIPAFQDGRVFVVDGSSYYNRSGPRIVDGIEILAALLHPLRVPGRLPSDAARELPTPLFA